MLQNCAIILLFMFFCGYLNPAIPCSEHAVENAIFDGYKNYLRPVKNRSTTTQVYVNTQIDILLIDGQSETIELILWTSLTWMDEFLKWNETDFEGCDDITTLASNIWVPDYMIQYTLEVKDIGMNSILYALITSNGTVRLDILNHIVVRCPMDIRDFPFDTQECLFIGSSWIYPSKYITLHRNLNVNPEAVLTTSSEFEAVSFVGNETVNKDDPDDPYTVLLYTLVLKRRPEYYVFVLIIPSFILTMLCIIGIFTPNSSGSERNEKMTLGLTTLLSMAVILNITADEMPKSSSGLPLLGYYVLYEIGVCVLSTIFSTVLICIHGNANRKQWNPPMIIRWIASIPSPLGCIRCIKKSDKQTEILITFNKVATSKLNGNGKNFIMTAKNSTAKSNTDGERNEMLASLHQIFSKIDDYLKKLDEDEEREDIWFSALAHIDLFLLVIFLCGNCVLTAITLL